MGPINNRIFSYESMFEQGLTYFIRIWDQPPVVHYANDEGRICSYMFDFLVLHAGHRIAREVKPASRVASSGLEWALELIPDQARPELADAFVLRIDEHVTKHRTHNPRITYAPWNCRNPDRVEVIAKFVRELHSSVSIRALADTREDRTYSWRARRTGMSPTYSQAHSHSGCSRMASVFFPNKDRLIELGFESVAHVPVLFDSSSRYCREFNRYLRERASLGWVPKGAQKTVILAERSLRTIAYHLVNFIEWCEARQNAQQTERDPDRADWRTLTYSDVLEYQREQRTGAWSDKNRPLEPETANARADLATDFLGWAAARGLRRPFEVNLTLAPRIVKSGKSSRSSTATRLVRVGREKESKSKALQTATSLPKIEEVRDWLCAVRKRRGYAKYLACRFILEIGARNHEVAAVTVDQWPTRETLDWLQSRREPAAVMELTVTKGSVPRDVRIPIGFADEVRRWIDGPRLRLNTQFYKREKKRASNQLFLSDSRGYEGVAIREYTIYRCFREVKPRPPCWSPHLGRHAHACFYVLQALELDAKIAGKNNIAEMGADWVMNRGDWWLKTLRRQLGHASEETTEIYLRWLMSATQLAALASGWHQYLNTEDR